MRILTYAFLTIVLVFGFNASAGDNAPYKNITAEELVDMQKAGGLVIIDSRGGKYFDGTIIEGAVHLSVKETDAESLGKVLPSKDSKVVFYCTNTACPASELSAYKAAAAGYTDLYKYPGGIEDWKEKGLPTSKLEVDS